MIIHNNTAILSDDTVKMLYEAMLDESGTTTCPLGLVTYHLCLDGSIEATSEYNNYGSLD